MTPVRGDIYSKRRKVLVREQQRQTRRLAGKLELGISHFRLIRKETAGACLLLISLFLLECRHAVELLEPLSDDFHRTLNMHKVILADSILPLQCPWPRCAGSQPKEFYRRDSKRDFESPHLIVNRFLLGFQQVLDLRSSLSRSYIHGMDSSTISDQIAKKRLSLSSLRCVKAV